MEMNIINKLKIEQCKNVHEGISFVKNIFDSYEPIIFIEKN